MMNPKSDTLISEQYQNPNDPNYIMFGKLEFRVF